MEKTNESIKMKNKLQKKTSFKKLQKIKNRKKIKNHRKKDIGNKTINDSVKSTENENLQENNLNESIQEQIKTETSESNNLPKGSNRSKHGRMIIRNLPFKTTDENLYSYLQQIGRIRELNLLKKPDGSLVGCAFVQYWHKKHGEIAMGKLNKQKFLGRPIIFDWAIPKTQYVEITKKEKVEQTEELDTSQIKPEESDDNQEISQTEDNFEVKSEEENEEEEEEEKDKKSIKKFNNPGDFVSLDGNKNKKRKMSSDDVSEGKTVFIKNIPFTAEEEDLKNLMEKYGQLYYAKICIDPLTEHSKGTGFVKFHTKENADECLKAGTELVLNDQILDVYPALNRKDILEKKQNKDGNKSKSDNRNLYLIKEGLVLAGSKAALNVSTADMEKRLQLERWKTQMLKNLNMFVSRERLIIHNVPSSWDNTKLRNLVEKHSNPNTKIKEVRIMRDLKTVDTKSKEIGFVSFYSHEDALHFLRKVNNNPDIFSISKRPIVSFSIENRKILNLKQKRIDKSRIKNPTFQKKINPIDSKTEKIDNDKKKDMKSKKKKMSKNNEDPKGNDEQSYSGFIAKPGLINSRSKLKMRTQSQMHRENANKLKRKQKMIKKLAEAKSIRKEKERMPQKNMKSNKEDDHFNKLVNKYKTQITSALETKKKWYDDS